jgi:hypothetical protein
MIQDPKLTIVVAGLVPAIHEHNRALRVWIAGTSPATTRVFQAL